MTTSASTEHILTFFAELIEKELGIRYPKGNHYQLETRLKEIATQLGLESIEALFEKCKSIVPLQIKNLVLDVATNNETSFFRDKDVFAAFKEAVLEGEFGKSDSPRLKIWSAACSTGQEVYSLAMMCEDWKEKDTSRYYEIFATDYSQRVLTQAKNGEYSGLEVQRGLPATTLVKWFIESHGDGKSDSAYPWSVKPVLRSRITFSQQNLLSPFKNKGPFHVVFCRNVLIYFDVEIKKQVIEKITNVLVPGGLLIMGAAESLIGITDKLQLRRMGKCTFYEKIEPEKKRA